jgi:hypothetical protein
LPQISSSAGTRDGEMGVKAAILNLDAGVSRGRCGAAGQLGQRRHITGHAHPEHAAAKSPYAR